MKGCRLSRDRLPGWPSLPGPCEFVVRWTGLLVGLFLLVGRAGELFAPGTAADWILFSGAGWGTVGLGIALVAAGLAPPGDARLRALVSGTCLVFAARAALDAVAVRRVLAAGSVHSSSPVHLSELLATLLVAEAGLAWRRRPVGVLASLLEFDRRLPVRWLAAGAIALYLPLVHLLTFGATDYRRPADVVIVLGARVRPDGSPSPALADRLATALALHRAGWAGRILVSGATGREGHDEATVMADWLVERGVDPAAVLVDSEGVNTAATVANARRILGPTRALVVSHGYHGARLQLAFRRAGIEVATVPAEESEVMVGYPWFVTRECLAYAVYFARGDGRPGEDGGRPAR